MRPLRLDLDGFGTFRDPVTLDFSDADYFALVGATGSGKTTLIDAICFALYGSAPRWPRRNQVSLAMAPSTSHTRVSLVFETAGRRYAAVRAIARAAKGQVSTKQSRLVELSVESSLDGDLAEVLDAEIGSLAESPDDMATAVADLLGLTWDHFIQCVVLPQGGFAKFLHAAKADRQDLLVSLLGLSLYGKVGQRANQAAKAAEIKADTLRDQLVKYADATEDAEKSARDRAEALSRVESGLAELLAPWLEAEAAVEAARAETTALADLRDSLAGVTVPADLDELTVQRTTAVTALADAVSAVETAGEAEEKAETAAEEAGEPSRWQELLAQHSRATTLGQQLRDAEARLKELTDALQTAEKESHEAADAQQQAADGLEHVRTANRADELAHVLVAGQNCPVCLQTVETVPDRPRHAGLSAAETALSTATKQAKTAVQVHNRAQVDHGQAGSEVTRITGELDTVATELEGEPSAEDARRRLETATTAHAEVAAARKAHRAAMEGQRTADAAIKRLDKRFDAVGRELGRIRDDLAQQRPPALTGDHVSDWHTFTAWARTTADDVNARLAERATATAKVEQAAAQRRDAVVEFLTAGGVPVPAALTEVSVRLAVGQAVNAAQQAVERIRERREEASTLLADIEAAESAQRLNRDLGLLLSARNFERWMVEEAMQSMVVEASQTLHELSNGQFELVIDSKQDILVVDHNDASMARPVQTLSGGETFQASLALALALSSQIASLSAGGGQLDTILLDEGFGTLDASTLDVVASTLEQLAGGGERTVGLVTHVAALADRVPVRFEVSRAGSRSTVSKVAT